MPVPFSQTLESRQPDISRILMLGLLIAVPLAVVWGIWFFVAVVPVYESSAQVNVADYERSTQVRTEELVSSSRAFVRKKDSGAVRARAFSVRKLAAVFPEKSLARIARNQQGYFFPGTSGEDPETAIPVTVIEVPGRASKKPGPVMLRAEYEYPAGAPDPFAQQTGGTVRIAVGRMTPAEVLARSSGLRGEPGMHVPISYSRTKRAAP